MTKMLVSVLAIVVGTAASATPAHSQTAANSGGPPRHALTIRAKQDEFKVGDEIRIEIALKNSSNQQFLVAPVIPTAEISYRTYVQDEKGDLAPETKYGRRLRIGKDEAGRDTVIVGESAPLRYLQPGESLKEEIILNRLYDLSKPGRYMVRVQAQSDVAGMAKSNAITITVVSDTKGDAR
jgi:hypothetical protein